MLRVNVAPPGGATADVPGVPERLERLQRLTEALGELLSEAQVARTVLEHGLAALGGSVGSVVLLVPGAAELEVIGVLGYTASTIASYERIPLALPTPHGEAVRTGKPVFLGTEEEIVALMKRPAKEGAQAIVSVPLQAGRRTLGAMGVTFRSPRTFDAAEREFAVTVGRVCAQALERAQAFTRLERAVRARDEFLAIAGHELRTPLTALKLQLQSALRLLVEGEANRARALERTEKAARQADRLSALVERLLDVSKVGAGNFTLELGEVDLGELAADVCGRSSEELAASGCTWSLEGAPGVRGNWDRLRLEQLLANLLSNAVKFAPGQPIAVSVRREGSRALLSVRDHGPGIPHAEQTRVFERFEQLAPGPRAQGLGLGLWISRRIAEAHAGALSLRSEPGEGAEFTLSLPL
jgi:signal transduction histidine kinase